MIGLGLRLGMGRGGAGGGGPVAPVITGEAYDGPTDTITANVDQAGTAFWYFNLSATPLSAAFIIANAAGSAVVTVGTNYLTADDTGLPSGTNYLHFTVRNATSQAADPGAVVSFEIPDPVLVSEVRSMGSFGSSYALAVGPSLAGDEILICVQHTDSNNPSAANFDLIHTATRNTQRYSVLRWNGTGSRPNNSNVTVTMSAANNTSLISLVVTNAFVASSSFGSNTGPGATHYTGTLPSAEGMLVALISSNNEVYNYSVTSPGPPPALALPISTDFSDGQVSHRLSASFGLRVACIQHSGPSTPMITIAASGGASTGAYVILAMERNP